jgi:hypothetical protein
VPEQPFALARPTSTTVRAADASSRGIFELRMRHLQSIRNDPIVVRFFGFVVLPMLGISTMSLELIGSAYGVSTRRKQ